MPPITADELQTLTVQIWAIGFALSLATGVLIHRGHFCTMGAISDWVLMRNATRLRQWALALAVAILGFGAMAWAGWIEPAAVRCGDGPGFRLQQQILGALGCRQLEVLGRLDGHGGGGFGHHERPDRCLARQPD
jgi:hypothetical protein